MYNKQQRLVMPKRRRSTKKNVRRKRFRRKRRYRRAMVPRGLFAKSFKQSHRYITKIALNPGVGTFSGTVFSANGMYDPDISGTGHQPFHFDQLSELYNHYTVIGSKITVTFMAPDTTTQYICAIHTNAGTAIPTSITNVLEAREANWKYLSSSTAGGRVTVNRRCSLKKFLSQKVMQEDQNAGTASGNPDEQVYFHVLVAGFDATTDPPVINAVVTIDYIAVWHEKKHISGS